jgi:cell division transport system ATP-binding protein
LFEAFNQVGVTVLIASHDLVLISRLHHRILTLRDGRLVTGGAQ